MSNTITYAVELHEKKGEEETGYGDYIKTVGVFEKENDAFSFLYDCENYIKDNEVIGVYECYETPVSSKAELERNFEDLKTRNLSENDEEYTKFDELMKLVLEIESRHEVGNLVIPEYYNLSFVDLCNKGIDLLTQIRDE